MTWKGTPYSANWDWRAGEAEYRRAVEIDPHSVDAATHYVHCLHALTHWQAAEQEINRALGLDPVSVRLNHAKLRLLTDTHRYDRAIEQYRKMVELDSHNPLAYGAIVPVFEALGREDDAIAAQLKADALWSGTPVAPKVFEAAAREGGLRSHARKQLEALQKIGHPLGRSPVFLAGFYTQLGDKDNALRFLEIAYREHRPHLMWLKSGAGWDPLRSDPRFQSLLVRMHFPD